MTDAERRYCGEEGEAYWKRNAKRVKKSAPQRAETLRRLIPNMSDRWHWLEIGCGRGNNLIVGDVGLDCDPRQLHYLNNHIIPIVGHAYDLSMFIDDSFPVVLSVGCLMHLPHPEVDRALAEMARVSKHYVIIGEYWADEEAPVTGRHWKGCLWKRPYTVPGMHLVRTVTHLAPFDPDVIFGVFEK